MTEAARKAYRAALFQVMQEIQSDSAKKISGGKWPRSQDQVLADIHKICALALHRSDDPTPSPSFLAQALRG